MTKREFYTAVMNGQTNEDIMKFASELLSTLDSANAKSRSKRTEKRAEEDAPLMAKVVEFLHGQTEPVTSSKVAEALEISNPKATALLKQIDGIAVTEVKNGRYLVKGYALA